MKRSGSFKREEKKFAVEDLSALALDSYDKGREDSLRAFLATLAATEEEHPDATFAYADIRQMIECSIRVCLKQAQGPVGEAG